MEKTDRFKLNPIAAAAFALAVCIAPIEIKHAECRVGCRASGYETGRYENDRCLCFDTKTYLNTTRQKLTLPSKTGTYKNAATMDAYRISERKD
jgi:hypothetical protein